MLTPEQFNQLLPLACAWALEQEQHILKNGVPLSPSEMADARLVGVTQPKQVRLLGVPQMPLPNQPELRAAAQVMGLLTPETMGMTLRYGIFIRANHWGRRRLIVHELAHTAQYERLGGFLPFLQQYLNECLTVGYHAAPLEQEAIEVTRRICT